MLSDVEDRGSLVGLAELRLIYLALDLVVILQVCIAVIHAFQEGVLLDEVAGGEFRRHCIQGARSQ